MASPDAAPSFRAWTHSSPPFPSTLSLQQQTPPTPAHLQPHQILVEVHAAALNPVDVQFCNLPIFRLPALSYPRGIGCDFAGVVLAKGKDVKDLEMGAQVMGVSMAPLADVNGGVLSEISVIDTTRATVVRKPPHLSWSQAAAVPLVYLTARTCLSVPYFVLPRSASENPTSPASHRIQPAVVVLGGSSAVGQYAIQLAKKRLHAKVVVTCSGKNADFVKSLGADEVVDYTAEDVVGRLLALRPDSGYVTIIDCVGGRQVLDHAAALLSPRSRDYPQGGSFTTIVGDKTERSALGGSMLYWWHPRMFLRMVRGWYGRGARYSCIMLKSDKAWLGEIGHAVADEGFQVPIDSEFAFEQVEEAYKRLETSRATGKIVVKVRSD
ncbi:hypothetical protein Rhopal_005251-T1 [Rhodotorula paludigena]|uniref:Enoyl reductase (ER) domain-containing protein n=1 Tax=Rhodotorula paludigena TaxID=86838 RepID=A0AAV5GHT5_9BASI|nr:hypothetical protein Rhopal_005251-T1 [Rhodotorula paludigena]